ncbi:MAG TPA: hypothetical protein VJU82_01405 [Acidobacteriaceae bacterium]|nr:hypothetical protein [Acidobacteriaceae bacterium]
MASTQNTLIVIGDNTISTSFKAAQVRWLQQFSRATGLSMDDVLERSVNLFRKIEAPVYRAECRQTRKRRQHA